MVVSRRHILGSTVAVASLCAAPAIVRAAQTRKLRLGHVTGPDTTIGRGAAAFAEALAKLSDGRLTVEIFPNNVLGSENEMAKAVSQGTLDLGHAAFSALGELSDEVGLCDAPYLFRDAAHARACFDGALGRHCAELLKAKNVTALGFGENGLRHMTANKPIRTPSDLKGLKLRTPTSKVITESFRALGAEAEGFPWAQLPEAFRTGRFEAQENPIVNILSGKLNQWQSHITLTGHIYAASVFAVSMDVWDELSAEDRAALTAAAAVGVKASRDAADVIDRDGLVELKKLGMTVVADVDRAPFVVAAGAVGAKLSELFGADKVQRIRSLAA